MLRDIMVRQVVLGDGIVGRPLCSYTGPAGISWFIKQVANLTRFMKSQKLEHCYFISHRQNHADMLFNLVRMVLTGLLLCSEYSQHI